MVIDCFLFFDEIDLLEIRLNELKDVVDVFVLTESPYTFTGKEKPFVSRAAFVFIMRMLSNLFQ